MRTCALFVAPRTVKSPLRLWAGRCGQPFLVPSAAHIPHQKDRLQQIRPPRQPAAAAVHLKWVRHRLNRRRADPANRMETACGILVKAGVLADACAAIVASQDGSRVLPNRQNPRAEIQTKGLKSGKPSGSCI